MSRAELELVSALFPPAFPKCAGKFYSKGGFYLQISLGNAKLNKMAMLAVVVLNQLVWPRSTSSNPPVPQEVSMSLSAIWLLYSVETEHHASMQVKLDGSMEALEFAAVFKLFPDFYPLWFPNNPENRLEMSFACTMQAPQYWCRIRTESRNLNLKATAPMRVSVLTLGPTQPV